MNLEQLEVSAYALAVLTLMLIYIDCLKNLV